MSASQVVSRAMVAGVFLHGGGATLLEPAPRAEAAASFLMTLRRVFPFLPPDPDLVRLNAGVQVVAGAALALGIRQRLAARVLALSLVPTTLAGRRRPKVSRRRSPGGLPSAVRPARGDPGPVRAGAVGRAGLGEFSCDQLAAAYRRSVRPGIPGPAAPCREGAAQPASGRSWRNRPEDEAGRIRAPGWRCPAERQRRAARV